VAQLSTLGVSAAHTRNQQNNKQTKMKATSLVALLIASIQFTGYSQDQKQATNAPTQVPAIGTAHIEVVETTDVKSGDSKGIKLRLQLTGDKDGTLNIKANQIFIETTKTNYLCNWSIIQFFPNAKTQASIDMTTVQVGDQFLMLKFIDKSAELVFDFKAGEQNEAELLFWGVDKSQAIAFHFGTFPTAKIK
jgi:hypothetical protein